MMDLEPCYDFENSTNCVSLIQGLPCTFVFGGKEFNSQANVVFDTDGSVDVRTEVPKDLEDPFFFWPSKLDIESIVLNGQKIPAFISRMGPSPSENVSITFTPNQKPFPITGFDETPLSKVIFHLFNFKDKKGTTHKVIKSENSWYSLGVTELESRKWKIELHEVKKTDEADNRKKHSPFLSHVCCLTRSDGSEFTGEAARQMLLDLRLFFTFSQGAFCPPVMPVGYDINDKKVWALGLGPHHPDSSMSWFDQHHSEELVRLFPGFMSRLENDRWHEIFQTVIYWGARSNNTHGGGMDTGIILTQIALERLAYECSLDDPDNHDPHSFDKLPNASSKLRYLFSRLDLPLDIPHNFNEIKELSDKNGFADAPRFLTELRNSMVHPINKQRHLFTGLYPDAWRLGLWYLELAILRLCNYEGTYASRLADNHFIGEVEEVPWTKKEEST